MSTGFSTWTKRFLTVWSCLHHQVTQLSTLSFFQLWNCLSSSTRKPLQCRLLPCFEHYYARVVSSSFRFYAKPAKPLSSSSYFSARPVKPLSSNSYFGARPAQATLNKNPSCIKYIKRLGKTDIPHTNVPCKLRGSQVAHANRSWRARKFKCYAKVITLLLLFFKLCYSVLCYGWIKVW